MSRARDRARIGWIVETLAGNEDTVLLIRWEQPDPTNVKSPNGWWQVDLYVGRGDDVDPYVGLHPDLRVALEQVMEDAFQSGKAGNWVMPPEPIGPPEWQERGGWWRSLTAWWRS